MDSFHIWHKWSLAWEGVSHEMTFDLDLYLQGHSTLFWFGTQHDSIVWVIMRRRGVSSERRRSSCSSSSWSFSCHNMVWHSIWWYNTQQMYYNDKTLSGNTDACQKTTHSATLQYIKRNLIDRTANHINKIYMDAFPHTLYIYVLKRADSTVGKQITKPH